VVGEPADAGLLGRENKGEVVLVGRLRAVLEKLNASHPAHAALPAEAIASAISGLCSVSPAGEMTTLGEIRVWNAGHGSGHKSGQKTGIY